MPYHFQFVSCSSGLVLAQGHSVPARPLVLRSMEAANCLVPKTCFLLSCRPALGIGTSNNFFQFWVAKLHLTRLTSSWRLAFFFHVDRLLELAQPTTSFNSGWQLHLTRLTSWTWLRQTRQRLKRTTYRSPRPFLQPAGLFNSSLAMLVSTLILCWGDDTWRGWLRVYSVDKLAVSARDTEVPEDQVIYVGCDPVLYRWREPKVKSEFWFLAQQVQCAWLLTYLSVIGPAREWDDPRTIYLFNLSGRQGWGWLAWIYWSLMEVARSRWWWQLIRSHSICCFTVDLEGSWLEHTDCGHVHSRALICNRSGQFVGAVDGRWRDFGGDAKS